MLTKVDQS
jgi:hypothetical protein